MWIAYVLKLSNAVLSELTVKEYVNMWHAYIWDRRERENTIATLLTVWIANANRGKGQKKLTAQDIFTDGRFDKFLTEEDMAVFKELYGDRR